MKMNVNMKIGGISAVIDAIAKLFFLFRNSLLKRYAGKRIAEVRIALIRMIPKWMSLKKYAGDIIIG